MVRLQPVLSKPNWQSRRPHNPYSRIPFVVDATILGDSIIFARALVLESSTTHTTTHVSAGNKQDQARRKGKNGAHTYPSVRMEMLDRRRPSFSSPPPPVCLSLLSSPHDFCKHSRPCTNLAFDSLADTSCLVTRPVIR